ncbi:hypothetical protein K505DRAFT_341477 [Melanomma pulvis-pyrius CBS 109.77]|uniref:Protein kinase domain-containing protein n=1 Tax=Melanomma pulvis-pyrius CBS 109.77 TaxID=1314802 RepID=A0A6A6WZ65_9PLEO|nr:hypothetical protein K505DRAFT_341477 [Melanomma pulvis-pyrius CBS 109.77]
METFSDTPETGPQHSSLKEVKDLTDGKYVPIAHAGSGKHADVWLCIPNPSASTPNANLDGQLVAVKVPAATSRDRLRSEISVLQRIAASAGPLTTHFPTLLDAAYTDTEDPLSDVRWLALAAIPGCTAAQVCSIIRPDPLPEELVLHMYIQITSALRFIHSMTPALAHGDIHEGNIMLDPSKQDIPGYPNAVLIDFGNVDRDPTKAFLDHDRVSFYRMMKWLAMLGRGCKPKSHRGIVEGCGCGDFWVRVLKGIDERLDSVWSDGKGREEDDEPREFEAQVELARDGLSAEKRALIRELVERATGDMKALTGEEEYEKMSNKE